MKNKNIFAVFLLVSLIGCTSSDTRNNNEIPNPIDYSDDIQFNPRDPHSLRETPNGKNVTVGIIDSNFDVNNIEFRDSDGMSRITKDENYTGNTNIHGSLVAEIIGGKTIGIAPEVKMEGVSAGIRCTNGSNDCIKVYRNMYDNLYNKEIRIYNQSFGVASRTIKTTAKTDMPLSDPVIAFYRDKASTDSLFIWSAGNSGKDEVSAEAGLPYFYPEM
ncbi:S8 family serine peptidase, partial [Sebaldella termitidis]|uniref:S8 family serine peptidase n=1 Tax=Sebaldella termitidis TaxID=826 RepID=UPI003EB8D91E